MFMSPRALYTAHPNGFLCCLRITPLPLSFSPTASSDPLGAGSLFLFSHLFINPNYYTKRENHFFPYSTKPKALFGVKTPLQMFHSPLLINFSQHYEMLPLMLMLINLTISPNIATAIIMYIDPIFLNILIIFPLNPP